MIVISELGSRRFSNAKPFFYIAPEQAQSVNKKS
jgi:hypothetical protein